MSIHPDKFRQILCSIILLMIMSACSSQTSGPSTNTVAPVFSATETITPTFSPTSTLQDAIDFQNAVKHFNVDFNCDLICWNNFVPGKTSIGDVVTWMLELDPQRTLQPEDVSAYVKPDTFWGPSQVNLGVTYFSDDTQPTPLLRAYAIGIGNPNDLVVGDKDVSRWLLNTVLQRSGNPKSITIGHPPNNDFDLLLDYGGWGVEYTGNWEYNVTTPINGDVQGQRCPVTKTKAVRIWMYSPKEGSLFALIKSIGSKMSNINEELPFASLEPLKAETYITPNSITTFLDALKTTGCF